MSLAQMHREDIKAALRKQFGTMRQFEIANDLPKGSVHDVLRNRRSAKVEKAIETAIAANQSEKPDSKRKAVTHGPILGGR